MPKINIKIKEQKPDECLPACLAAVFDFYKIKITEDEIIETISKDSFKLYDWDFQAGKLAIRKGLKAEIYSNVPQLFDPSWLDISQEKLIEKMEKSLEFFALRSKNFENDPDLMSFMCPNKIVAQRLVRDAETSLDFLNAGGIINFNSISEALIEKTLKAKIPLIVSHNPTLLHRIQRCYNFQPDDIKGNSWGHYIIISGYTKSEFVISDPAGMSYRGSFVYKINKDLLLESILRYNGQLLAIKR
jgi:hypothetical protein